MAKKFRQLIPQAGEAWSEEEMAQIVQTIIALKRLGEHFFKTKIAEHCAPVFLKWLYEFFADDGIEKPVYIFQDAEIPTACWEILPGPSGLAVWTNVSRS